MHRVLLVAGLMTLATVAHAADDGDEHDATRLMKQGKALLARAQYEPARARYERACAIARTAPCLSSLALAELRAGRPLDAFRHLQEVLRDAEGAASVPAAMWSTLPALKAEAYGKIGHILMDAPSGTELTLDGAPIGTAPLADPLDVDVGDHAQQGLGNAPLRRRRHQPGHQGHRRDR